ncbi:hypothetical protein ABQF34_04010 [Mycolicibacterium boenickei]
MSRRFAGVGVGIAAARLRAIASGAPAADAELADVEFAVVAREFMHDERLAKFERGKRRCMMCLVVTAMGLVIFGSLVCMTVLLLSLMMHTNPF